MKHAIPRYSVISLMIKKQNRPYETSEMKRETPMKIVCRVGFDWMRGRLNEHLFMSVLDGHRMTDARFTVQTV